MQLSQIKDLYQKTLKLKRNQYLKVEGSVDSNIYYVESGSLSVFLMDDSQPQIIRFGYAQDMIVAMDSFLGSGPSDYYIQALKKSVVKVIPKSSFVEFIAQSPAHTAFWIKLLEELVLQQLEREKDLLTSSPKERYLRVLRRSPKLFQEIPNRHIANYLRMSPETLSRLKKS